MSCMTVAKKVFAMLPDQLEERLRERAKVEGRSLSNLISFLVEMGMHEWEPPQKKDQK